MRYGLDPDHHIRTHHRRFPAQSSVLDEQALLLQILPDYQIPEPDACRFLTRGAADIYRVHSGLQRTYLKIFRPPRTAAETEAEAVFVTALAAAGFPVVRPVPRRDGRFTFTLEAPEGLRTMLLFEEAPPPLPEHLTGPLLVRIGVQLAGIHRFADEQGSDDGVPVINPHQFIAEKTAFTVQFMDPDQRAIFDSAANRLLYFLNRQPLDPPAFGLCHGDPVLSNFRSTEDGEITCMDFGEIMRAWRGYDLAVIYWSLEKSAAGRLAELWDAFLQGYRSVQALPDLAVRHLPAMLLLRQVSFIGANCATLPLRLGTELFEGDFIPRSLQRLRGYLEEAGF